MHRSAKELEDASGQHGFMHFDFQTLYPHKFWISNWGQDESYPDGFRYKILTGLDRRASVGRLVILVEEPEELKTVMADLRYPKNELEHVAVSMAEHIAVQFGVEFTNYDFASVENFDDYCRLSRKNGWAGPERVP